MLARRLPLLVALASVASVACVGDVSSHEEAREAWLKTVAVLDDGDARIRGTNGESLPPETEFRAGSMPYSANRTFACPTGGTVEFRGNYYLDPGDGAFLGYDYEVELKRCTVDGLRIDGLLDVNRESDADGGTITYSGEVTWHDEIQGKCPLDLTMNPVGGTLCDFEAKTVLGG
ncbi:MAG: hypothetical protein R3B09_11560 [Nannocystaceae bacterium]